MARKKRPGKREGYGLPFAVLRGIVRENRFAPPGNRDPSLRQWPALVAERLSKIDGRVWALPVDWKRYAPYLDQCAKQEVLKRTVNKESTEHAKIAGNLRKVAILLTSGEQPDPTLFGTFHVLAKYYNKEQFSPFALKGMMPTNTPRLSDFLRATASFIEGERVRVDGVHALGFLGDELPKQAGKKAAAIEAAAAVRMFFLKHTKKPHNDLMVSVVAAYYPDVTERNWVSTLDKRAQAHGKAIRKIAKK